MNGVRTDPAEHVKIAKLIAEITESRVRGIYNQTEGSAVAHSQGNLITIMALWH